MKTTTLKALLAFVLGFTMLNFTTSKQLHTPKTVTKASCPYVIDNKLSCNVTVDITIYKVSAGCTAVCGTPITGLVIPAGTVYQVQCNGCSVCNIEVTVTDIGGTAITPTSVDFPSPGPVALGGGGCTSSFLHYSAGALPGGGAFKIL